MSQEHSAPIPLDERDALFLAVKAGMTVIVQHLPECGFPADPGRWWMADVIHNDGGARNPRVPAMFQVADVDSGEIRWINADLVTHIVPRCCP